MTLDWLTRRITWFATHTWEKGDNNDTKFGRGGEGGKERWGIPCPIRTGIRSILLAHGHNKNTERRTIPAGSGWKKRGKKETQCEVFLFQQERRYVCNFSRLFRNVADFFFSNFLNKFSSVSAQFRKLSDDSAHRTRCFANKVSAGCTGCCTCPL